VQQTHKSLAQNKSPVWEFQPEMLPLLLMNRAINL